GRYVARRGGIAAIVPGHGYVGWRRKSSGIIVDRDGRHPVTLRLIGLGSVEHDRSRPGLAVVGRAHVVNVAGRNRAFPGIGIMNHAIRADGGLTPSHVPNDGIDLGEIAVRRAGTIAHRVEARTREATAPGYAAIEGT